MELLVTSFGSKNVDDSDSVCLVNVKKSLFTHFERVFSRVSSALYTLFSFPHIR